MPGVYRRSSASQSEEARALARVAGGALLVDAREDDVGVAVDAELLPVLHVSARVALAPELLRASGSSRPCGPPRACAPAPRGSPRPSSGSGRSRRPARSRGSTRARRSGASSRTSSRRRSSRTGKPFDSQVLLDLADRELPEVEPARREHRVGAALGECLGEVVEVPAPPLAITGTLTRVAHGRSSSRS